MARCFPLPKGGELAPGSEGVVWRVRRIIGVASQLASLPNSFACPWLGSRRRHRTSLFFFLVLFYLRYYGLPFRNILAKVVERNMRHDAPLQYGHYD